MLCHSVLLYCSCVCVCVCFFYKAVCVVCLSGSGCKLEVGVSSCLLTPSASPGAAEERGMNEGM